MHAEQVDIRPVVDADKPRLWQAYEHAMRPHIEEIWGWDEQWQLAYFDKAFANASTQVVELDGSFAGYVQVDAGAELYLSMLILLPAYQSRGIGAGLLKQLLAMSHAKGCAMFLRVFRTNGHARRFYEREGWFVAADEGNFLLMRHAANHVQPAQA